MPRPSWRLFSIVLAGLMVAALSAQGRAPFNDSITRADLEADLYFLAGDGFRGRLVGTPENELAAEFIGSRFQRMGLAPAAGGSFFQHYHLATATLGSPNDMRVERGTVTLTPRLGRDFYPERFSASGRVRAPVAYAGFGITDDRLGYDDFAGDAIRGKIALVIDHEPGERDPESPFDGLVRAEASSPLRKALFAQQKGAVGILFVRDVHNHAEPENFEAEAQGFWPDEPPRIDRFTLAVWMDRVRIPAARISPALAATLVERLGTPFADLSRSAETSTGLAPLPIPELEVELITTVDRHVVPDRNVVALIEGADPQLKDELVIVSAHYDHNGADGAQVYNGADDDGSGIVGLLEIAEAYALAARDGQRPRRSVLFAAWNSEERGLLGAWAYTEAPLRPLERTAAVLNMDMIGRNEEVPAGGGARFRGLEIQTAESNRNAVNILGQTKSAGLKALVERLNQRFGLDLRMRYDNNESNLLRRSDQWPFLQRGVPALWFHTGLHPDYHTIYDRPEKINYEKMEKIARLVHEMSWEIANQDDRPQLTD